MLHIAHENIMFQDRLLSCELIYPLQHNSAGKTADFMRFSSSESSSKVATMMTLLEINRAHGMKQLFCAVDVGLVHSFLFFPPFASCTAPIQPLASPPPTHHSVCPQNQSLA